MPDDNKNNKIQKKRTYIVHPKHGVISTEDPEIFEIYPPEVMITPAPKPNKTGGLIAGKPKLAMRGWK